MNKIATLYTECFSGNAPKCSPLENLSTTVVTIVYGKPKKLLAESRTMSLSLRRFVALPKIVQADYQPRRPQDKTTQISV